VVSAVFCSVLAPVDGCMTLCWCCSLLVLSPPAGGLWLCCRLLLEDFCCATPPYLGLAGHLVLWTPPYLGLAGHLTLQTLPSH